MDEVKTTYTEFRNTIGWPGKLFNFLGAPLLHNFYQLQFKSHHSLKKKLWYITRIAGSLIFCVPFFYYYLKYMLEDDKFLVSKLVHGTYVLARWIAVICTNFLNLEYEFADLLVKIHDEVDLKILNLRRDEELKVLSREYLKALINVSLVVVIKMIDFDYIGFFNVYEIPKRAQALLLFATYYGDYADTYMYSFFLTYLSIIKRRFDALNRSLESLAESENRGNDYGKYCTTKLYLLYRVHIKYCKITKELNAIFGSILIYYLLGSTTMLFFKSLQVYLHMANEGMGWNAIRGILFILEIFREILGVVRVCSITCHNANSSAKILHNFRNKFCNKELESQIQMYSLQLIHQRISITLNGYLVIDFSLLYMIIGLVVSYLIILIQYEHGSSGEGPAS